MNNKEYFEWLAQSKKDKKYFSDMTSPLVAIEFNSATTNEEGGYPFPIFTERPFIRPLSRRGQLRTMIRYIQMNPQRLATKRLKPGCFRVQKDIVIGDRKYDGVGNAALLMEKAFDTVHVHHEWVDEAVQGRPQQLRDYMNGCVLKARKGLANLCL